MSTPPPTQLQTASKFVSPAASLRSLSQLLERDERLTPPPTTLASRPMLRPGSGAPAPLHSLLAAKESEAALLRQQQQQLTVDFKYNLKLLEERDLELERSDAVLVGVKEAAAAKEVALQEARRALAERESALRDRDARLAALQSRQQQVVELAERQVADARAARDEEVARCQEQLTRAQGRVAQETADSAAGYEKQLAEAFAAEREVRQRAAALTEEVEHVRSQLQRAEARLAEQELGMQRMVTQFEGALTTLQQLEAQYDALAADAGAAERLRVGRIAELERETEALRALRLAAQHESNAAVSQLQVRVGELERALGDSKTAQQRAVLDGAGTAEALAAARQELQALRPRAQQLELDLAAAQDAQTSLRSAADRQASAVAQMQGLLEAARLQADAARREGAAAQAEAAQQREAAALLEAQRNNAAKALEAATAKLHAATERTQLLAEQLEQERCMHAQLADGRESEAAARWERELRAAREERAALQQALDYANRQLQQSHQDLETLRLQLQHVRLEGASPLAGIAAAAVAVASPQSAQLLHHSVARAALAGAGMQLSPGARHGTAGSSLDAGITITTDEHDASVAGTTSPAAPDFFDSLPEPRQQLQRSAGRPAPANSTPGTRQEAGPYPDQLNQHMDLLARKLQGFQRAVEQARQAGTHASQQIAESSRLLPEALQRRQAEVTEDARLRQQLSAERRRFESEREQLDTALAEREQQLQQRERELERVQQAEALHQRERQLQQREREVLELSLQLQQNQQLGGASTQGAFLHVQAGAQPAADAQLHHQPPTARLSSLASSPASAQLPAHLPLGLARQQQQHAPLLPQPLLQPLRVGPSAGLRDALRTPWAASSSSGFGGRSLDPSPGAPLAGPSYAAAAGPPAAGEDPLARARRQVLMAKSYLRQVAEMGGQITGQPS